MTQANPYILEHGGRPPHAGLRKWATYISCTVALILIAAKLYAYLITDSVSLLSSLMDSTMDLLSSFILLLGVRTALQPADREHRFGHGKYESLAAMAQALFIFGSGAFLVYESLHRFMHPVLVQKTETGLTVMGLSMVMTLMLVAFQVFVIRKTKSVAIEADHLHYKGDLLTNLSVIVALFLGQKTGWPYFDPIFALGISMVLLYGAFSIARDAHDILVDRELSLEDREKIYNIVIKHPKVHAVHDLRTRSTGHHIFIEFHMEMDGDMTLAQAHDVTEEIELKLYKEFPQAEVMIHPEPHGIEDHRLDERVGDI